MISYRKEPQGLDFLSAYGVATDSDSDYDYDEYEFLPSISPSVLFPVTNRLGLLPPLAEEGLPRLPPAFDLEDDGLETYDEDSTLLSPLYSPTFTFVSDFAFPNHDAQRSGSTTGFSVIGYSKVFTSGLAAKSRKITRHLDAVLRKLRDVLRKLKPST